MHDLAKWEPVGHGCEGRLVETILGITWDGRGIIQKR